MQASFHEHGAPGLSWAALRRIAWLALGVTFALSTQLLFQFHLYETWPPADILLGWLEHFAEQVLVGAFIVAAVAGAAAVRSERPTARHLLILAAIALGALAGESLLLLRTPLPPTISAAGMLFAKVVRWEVIAGLAYLCIVFRQQGEAAAEQVHAHDVLSVQVHGQMTEARLQTLRAQIEPHFLFNTLANIQRLYQTDPSRGRHMLKNFVAYVRAALPQLRENETTLANEVALARAYLDVLQVRMADRLRVRIDVPDAVAALSFPSLALSTLTENAVKHGINPAPEGGAIDISARIVADALEVCVADTGVGLRQGSGTGVGLANLRARLAALYGDTARLTLETNRPRGIRAIITVPVRAAMAES